MINDNNLFQEKKIFAAGPQKEHQVNLIEHLKKSTDEFTLTAKIAMINLVLDGCFKFNPQGVQKVKVQMTPCFTTAAESEIDGSGWIAVMLGWIGSLPQL